MTEALIALGGNVGDVRQTLSQAIAQFCDGSTVTLLARSSDYKTPPWGVEDQPAFVNCAIAVSTMRLSSSRVNVGVPPFSGFHASA